MRHEIDLTDDFTQEVFSYLDSLRESGKINMFGAGQVLEQAYGFDSSTAKAFLMAWMENFGKDS